MLWPGGHDLAAQGRFRRASKTFNGLLESNTVEVLNELDDIAADLASAAVPKLFFGVYRKSIGAAAYRTSAGALYPAPDKPNAAAGNLVFDAGEFGARDEVVAKAGHRRALAKALRLPAKFVQLFRQTKPALLPVGNGSFLRAKLRGKKDWQRRSANRPRRRLFLVKGARFGYCRSRQSSHAN
jgi:hypothetical protein